MAAATEATSREQDYEVLQKIGQGSFGIIRKVRRRVDNTILCRKEISYSRMTNREKEQLAAELDILKTFCHPNIVRYYHREHIKSSHDIHLYMEYCGNGDLGGYIRRLKEKNVYAEEDFIWGVLAQLVGALYRCHNGEDAPPPGEESKAVKEVKGLPSKVGRRIILHRDLKPENVFLGTNNAVKLGDFGLSKIMASHDFASTYVGTPFYMSPEICAAERYSHHSDVWSLGCIIYELATRNVPFDARSHIELVVKIKAGRIKPLPECYSSDLWEVICWCLKVDPRQRPDTRQLLNVRRIREARLRLEQTSVVDRLQAENARMLQQIQGLQSEIATLREAGEKLKMEWHAKATLAIDQRVAECKAQLQQQFDAAVEQQVEEKLKLHQASLPQNHGLGQLGHVASHVRSSTPPPGKSQSSFATTSADSDGSSVLQSGDAELDTEISSLSIMDAAECDDVSPLAQRLKLPPKPRNRQPFSRAKTLANCTFDSKTTASPMDVHMADPSPTAPASIKNLGLSPRRNVQDPLTGGAGMRKNIFSMANEPQLRPTIATDLDSGFADDDLLDDDDEDVVQSPSRPTSGLSNHSNHVGDPFKAFNPPPQRLPRPSLARQHTMPAKAQPSRQRSTLFNAVTRTKAMSPEKENRPPSRSNVPVISASPKRAATTKSGKDLTPSRKAPPPPLAAPNGLPKAATLANLTKLAHANNMLSPGKAAKVQGQTLVELSQAQMNVNEADVLSMQPSLPSPAKWDPEMGDEMPSPFLAKKGRAMR